MLEPSSKTSAVALGGLDNKRQRHDVPQLLPFGETPQPPACSVIDARWPCHKPDDQVTQFAHLVSGRTGTGVSVPIEAIRFL